jgi:hypothetical protein
MSAVPQPRCDPTHGGRQVLAPPPPAIGTPTWSGLYDRIIRSVSPGHLFDRLAGDGRRFVLVTGCQRSGTSWLRKVLAETLLHAAAPKELDVCNFLVNGHALPTLEASVVVLQTTFANIYADSFARLPPNVSVVLMARNPYSVCRSLVYNWDSLSVEYAHRCGETSGGSDFDSDDGRWQAASAIYRQSMRAGLRIVTERPAHTRLLVYDEFVHDLWAGLSQLALLLGHPFKPSMGEVLADLSTTTKHLSLPAEFRQLITEQCLAPFEELLRRARSLGNRIEDRDG